MSKKKKHNRKGKAAKWVPPKNYKDFFDSASDVDFQAAHPVGYIFPVLLGITVLLLPPIIFGVFAGIDTVWALPEIIGGFVFGIGLFNFVAIIIDRYLGHWVSVICFSAGSIMMLISWQLCRRSDLFRRTDRIETVCLLTKNELKLPV